MYKLFTMKKGANFVLADRFLSHTEYCRIQHGIFACDLNCVNLFHGLHFGVSIRFSATFEFRIENL
jgi:hypothetical protein